MAEPEASAVANRTFSIAVTERRTRSGIDTSSRKMTATVTEAGLKFSDSSCRAVPWNSFKVIQKWTLPRTLYCIEIGFGDSRMLITLEDAADRDALHKLLLQSSGCPARIEKDLRHRPTSEYPSPLLPQSLTKPGPAPSSAPIISAVLVLMALTIAYAFYVVPNEKSEFNAVLLGIGFGCAALAQLLFVGYIAMNWSGMSSGERTKVSAAAVTLPVAIGFAGALGALVVIGWFFAVIIGVALFWVFVSTLLGG